MFSTELFGLVRATATATAATSLCWLAVHLSGRDLAVRGRDPSMPTPVPWGAVVLATTAGGVVAYGLIRIAERTTRPRRTFAVGVTTGLALSSLPPVQAATARSTALTLLAMHLIAAALIVPAAARLLQPRRPVGRPQATGTSR